MENPAVALAESASAVAALGCSREQIDMLDDDSLLEGMRLVRAHESHVQTYKLWLAAAIARKSDHEFGYAGLARKNGAATPGELIQSLTGSSLDDARRLANLGAMMNADRGNDTADGATEGGPRFEPIVEAMTTNGLTLAAADAIRRGLGEADEAVTAEQIAAVSVELVEQAAGVTPEALLKLARQARTELDLAAVARGEKERSALRYVRHWRKDGMSLGSWRIPDEDGGIELDTALKLLVAAHTGGPRFAASEPAAETEAQAPVDERSLDQIRADGFVQLFHAGITTDPSIVPGSQRAAVRVIVSQKVLDDRAGFALLEESMTPISFTKLEEWLCAGGTVGILFDDHGDVVNIGREQRLFTRSQRIALAVRDGGCRFPGCQKPASWTEAHHIDFWVRDHGRTDIDRGILLCRYHHMLMHNRGWEIRHHNGLFSLIPPAEFDRERKPIPMPTRNPLLRR